MEWVLYFNVNQEFLITFKQMSLNMVGISCSPHARAQCLQMGPVAPWGLVPSQWPLGISPRSKSPSMTQDALGITRESEMECSLSPFPISGSWDIIKRQLSEQTCRELGWKVSTEKRERGVRRHLVWRCSRIPGLLDRWWSSPALGGKGRCSQN